MRLLHVADRLTDRGGAYTHMLAVVEELARVHDVTLAVGRREGVEAPCPTVVCPGLDARAGTAVPELEALAAGARFDIVHVHTPGGPPCVAFVGRLAESKGVRDAIAAWKMSGVDLPLVLAGTGPLRDGLEREGYEVLGWLDRGRLSALYKRSRAVLLPSRWQEPFGIVGPEALAMNVPVVAWDSGGVAEWYRGERVEWGDVCGLARALRAAVSQRDDKTTRGRGVSTRPEAAGAGLRAGPPSEGPVTGDAPRLDRRDLMDRLLRLYAQVASGE